MCILHRIVSRLSMGALDQNTEVRQTSDNNETDAKCRGERKEEEEEGEGKKRNPTQTLCCWCGRNFFFACLQQEKGLIEMRPQREAA